MKVALYILQHTRYKRQTTALKEELPIDSIGGLRLSPAHNAERSCLSHFIIRARLSFCCWRRGACIKSRTIGLIIFHPSMRRDVLLMLLSVAASLSLSAACFFFPPNVRTRQNVRSTKYYIVARRNYEIDVDFKLWNWKKKNWGVPQGERCAPIRTFAEFNVYISRSPSKD